MKSRFLAGRRIGISISESPDMAVLGMGKEHLEDAMAEIARHLIACGAKIAYGGDLREGGFTELLFEIIDRYRSDGEEDRILVENYLAWPVHTSMAPNQIEARRAALKGLADLILLKADGTRIELPDQATTDTPAPGVSEWSAGLTAMRRAMASNIDARIALGGRTTDYLGSMPGIAEEALIQLERKAPLFVLGGFGGCSLAIAKAMRLDRRNIAGFSSSARWEGVQAFRIFGATDLRNGLAPAENQQLAETVHIDEAATLILRGLINIESGRPEKRKPRRN